MFVLKCISTNLTISVEKNLNFLAWLISAAKRLFPQLHLKFHVAENCDPVDQTLVFLQ